MSRDSVLKNNTEVEERLMHLFTGDVIGSLNRLTFSPDPISRFQYDKVHEAKKGLAEHQAERDLMLAVLEDAIACFQGYFSKPSRTNEKLFLEAEEWITSNDDDVFSFNNICETLGLDPDALRKGLRRWQVENIHKVPWERKRLVPNKGKRPAKESREPRTCSLVVSQ